MTQKQMIVVLGIITDMMIAEGDNEGRLPDRMRQAVVIRSAWKKGLLNDIDRPSDMSIGELSWLAEKRLKKELEDFVEYEPTISRA